MLNSVTVTVNGEVQGSLTMAHTKASVTDVDSVIIPENLNRKYLLIVNNTDTNMIVSLGGAVADDKGIPLNAGSNFQLSKDYLFTGAVHAIHKTTGSTKVLDVTEGE